MFTRIQLFTQKCSRVLIEQLKEKLALYERHMSLHQNCIIILPGPQIQQLGTSQLQLTQPLAIGTQSNFIQSSQPTRPQISGAAQPSNTQIIQHLQNEVSKVKKVSKSSGDSCVIGKNNRRYKLMKYFDLSRKAQYAVKSELETEFRLIGEKLQTRGLSYSNLQIFDRLNDKNENQVQLKIVQQDNHLDSNAILLKKDEARLSDRSYHMFSKSAPHWPSLHQAKQFRHHLRLLFPTTKTRYGVNNNAQHKIQKMLELHRNELKIDSDKLQIKLSADGAQIGKKAKILHFTFSFLQHFKNSKFVDANFTLGLFDCDNENFDTVKDSFHELLQELENIKVISVNNIELQVEFYFAADEKMLAILMGVSAANGNYPCIYCVCHKDQLHDTLKMRSIKEVQNDARSTFNEAIKMFSSKEQKGQIRKPIINFIPFSNFVIDLLHANLRISEVLFKEFVKKLYIKDIKEKDKQHKRKRQEIFKKYLIENIRIFNPVYDEKEAMKLKNFDRDENLRILSQVPLTILFTDIENIDKIE